MLESKLDKTTITTDNNRKGSKQIRQAIARNAIYIKPVFCSLLLLSLSLSLSLRLSYLSPDLFINRCIFGYGTFHTCTKTRLELCTLYAAVHIPKPYPIFYTLFAIGICFRGNNQKKVVLLINQQLESAFHDLICR